MAGTIAGGKKAAKVNKEKYGVDFYKNIGKKGGTSGHTGGFYADKALARRAGRIGGLKSKRGPAKVVEITTFPAYLRKDTHYTIEAKVLDKSTGPQKVPVQVTRLSLFQRLIKFNRY